MFKLLVLACFMIPLLASIGYSTADNDCKAYKFYSNQTSNKTHSKNDTKLCAMINGSISFTYKYKNSPGDNVTMVETLPCNATPIVLACDASITIVRMEWNSSNITFVFNAATKNRWSIGNLTVNIKELPQVKNSSSVYGTLNGNDIVGADLDYERSFRCKANKTYDMTTNSSNVTMTITMAGLQVQAFKFTDPSQGEFGNVYQCDADITGSKIVPIAVGAALAGLVVIVLIAYIIGRLRSRRKSAYESLS